MISCLIVDDERISREGLKEDFNWEQYGIKIVATAKNGKVGLEKFKEYKPNIVISDIKMPIMDGIEMLKKIREIESDVLFILLSAYGEFEYAQQAIQYNVQDYILKPVEESELRCTIKKIVDKYHLTEKKIRKNTGIKNILENPIAIPLKNDEKILVVLTNGVRNNYLISNECLVSEGEYRGRHVIVLKGEKTRLAGLLQLFENAYISKYIESESSLSMAYKEAEIAEQNGEFWGKDKLDYDSVVKQRKSLKKQMQLIDKELGKNISELKEINKLNPQKEKRHPISQFLKFLKQFQFVDEELIKNIIMRFFLELTEKTPLIVNKENLFTIKDHIYNFKSFAEIEEFLTKELDGYIAELNKTFNASEKSIVEKIKKVIQEEYTKEIGIKDIAERVFLSPNYAGQIFRSVTGKYVNEYLLEIRLKKAKEILRETDMSISQVAKSVGITSQSYFSSLFKKRYGLTPKEFKMLHILYP